MASERFQPEGLGLGNFPKMQLYILGLLMLNRSCLKWATAFSLPLQQNFLILNIAEKPNYIKVPYRTNQSTVCIMKWVRYGNLLNKKENFSCWHLTLQYSTLYLYLTKLRSTSPPPSGGLLHGLLGRETAGCGTRDVCLQFQVGSL